MGGLGLPAEDDDVEEVDALDALALVIGVRLAVDRQAEPRDGLAGRGELELRVPGEVAQEHYPVEACHEALSLLAYKCLGPEHVVADSGDPVEFLDDSRV